MEILQNYEGQKVAVYGLSPETEKKLPELQKKLQIVGLLDCYHESGQLYGVPIISMMQAIESKVKLIIAIAKPGSCRAIAKRIGELCCEHNIMLIDIHGKNLCEINPSLYGFKVKKRITKKELTEKINKNDIVSVDFFDTIFMRRVLFPEDVFELVEAELKERGIVLYDFVRRRINSEKELSRDSAPDLFQIYSHLLRTERKSGEKIVQDEQNICAEELVEIEWRIDKDLLIPRREVCDLLMQAQGNGKQIYVISDSYYHKKQLESLLLQWNLNFFVDIFSSCEFGTGKTQFLFSKIQEKIKEKKWLHIGDDISADIKSAEKNGLEAYRLYSAVELLEMSGYLGLWESINGLVSRIKTGIFIARLFNSPFQFEKDGNFQIYLEEDLGYLFFAPIITDFVFWFLQQINKNKIENVWFCARDGYLIKKLYDKMCESQNSVYFLTSRIAAIRAGIENEEDIHFIEEMKFSGTLQQQMWERYGIKISEEESLSKKPIDYTETILQRAKTQKRNYQIYIDTLELKKGEIAFLDFVARGTCQKYCSKLIGHSLHGFYFQKIGKEENLKIDDFYGNENGIFENYDILETVLASTSPSILGFDENGNAIYASEYRTPNEIQCILKIQDGIEQYFEDFLKICPKSKFEIQKEQDELFFKMMYHFKIAELDFQKIQIEDAFFNRIINISDLL